MKVELYLVITHYLDKDNAVEACAIMKKLSKKHIMKASIIVDILSQSVLKNDSGYKDDEKLLDHYYAKYKEAVAESLATLMLRAEKYPYVAQQLEQIRIQNETENTPNGH